MFLLFIAARAKMKIIQEQILFFKVPASLSLIMCTTEQVNLKEILLTG